MRLAEIDAPERDQPFYLESARSLAAIYLKKSAVVEEGKVECDGVDAEAEQVRRGMAWLRAQRTLPNSPLYEMEAHARLRQLGLWAGNRPIPPWEWRQRQRAR